VRDSIITWKADRSLKFRTLGSSPAWREKGRRQRVKMKIEGFMNICRKGPNFNIP
jgi:hypothetical protein